MNASIYVGNLAGPYISPEMLRSIFGCIGAIDDVRIGKTGRYAFVDFRDPKCAVMALGLNGTLVAGEPLLVEQTKSKPGGPEMGFPGPNPRSSRPYGNAAPYPPAQFPAPSYSRPPYSRNGPPSGDRVAHRGHGQSDGSSFNLRRGQLPTPEMVLGALNVLGVAVKSGMNPVQMAKATGKPVDPDLHDFVEEMAASIQSAKRQREEDEEAQRKRAKASEDKEPGPKNVATVSGEAEDATSQTSDPAADPMADAKDEAGSANGEGDAGLKADADVGADATGDADDADDVSETSERRSERTRRRRDMDAEEDE